MSGRRWHHWKPRWRQKTHRNLTWQPPQVELLNTQINALKTKIEKSLDSEKPELLRQLLILQAPRAALAQAQMDAHPHGYHDREKRLYELIDFNDTLVDAVLALSPDELKGAAEKLRQEMDEFCHQQGSPTFTDKQYDAIVHGLSREIAVYKACENAGLEAKMTSRAADAFGIDMEVRDRASGQRIYIDCKTTSAFHFRLKDLVQQGRISNEDLVDGETAGFLKIENRGRGIVVRIILLRISQDELGDIMDFQFVNEGEVISRIREILHYHGQRVAIQI